MYTINGTAILKARQRLRGIATVTPCGPSRWLGEQTGRDIFLKWENVQVTGSFKLRGALNKLLYLRESGESRPLVTVSAGNHGRAVAFGAEQLGMEATIIVPKSAAPTKVQAIARHRVRLEEIGSSYDEAEREAPRIAERLGARFLSPYNDPEVIAGQGTAAWEMIEAVPDLDVLLIPVGGGGLLAGAALAARSLNPALRVIGVQPRHAPAMHAALQAGRIVPVTEKETIADGLAGNIEAGAITFPIIKENVEQIWLVDETAIERAILETLAHEHMVIEGSAAVVVAALLDRAGREERLGRGRRIGAMISGGNIDLQRLKSLFAKAFETESHA